MKLLAKYNRINIIITISVLLISSICFYIMIRHVLINQLDEDLKLEEQEIVDFVKINNKLPDPSNYEDQQIEFRDATDIGAEKKFTSVVLIKKHHKHKEEELARQYQFSLAVNDKMYNVLVRKSQEETEDLIKMIAWITLGIVMFLLLILFFINCFSCTNVLSKGRHKRDKKNRLIKKSINSKNITIPNVIHAIILIRSSVSSCDLRTSTVYILPLTAIENRYCLASSSSLCL